MRAPASYEQVLGRGSSQGLSWSALRQTASSAGGVALDLGCGDGLFAYRLARMQADWLFVGVDTDRASLAIGARKALRKPSRGGCDNVRFLCLDALDLPREWKGMFDRVTIHFPWAVLLRAVSLPDPAFLHRLRGLVKEGGALEIHLNSHVFEDSGQRASLELPELSEEYLREILLPAYRKSGWEPLQSGFLPPEALRSLRTAWAGRLLRGSRRATYRLRCGRGDLEEGRE